MITVYFKPTNYCNVGCSHCYLPEEVRANGFKMDMDNVRKSANFIKDFLALRKASRAFIIWHGGEPLVLGKSYFDQASVIFKEVLGEGVFQQGIQTSLIPFRKEHISVVHDYFQSEIGSSVDFSQRTISDSVEKYLDLFMKKVSIARENNIGIVPGFVPTKNELGKGKDIVKWFSTHDFSIFNIDRYNNYNITVEDRPSNREHASFLIELFDAIFELKKQGKKAPLINVVESGIKGVLAGVSSERWGTTCQSDFIVIEPNGNLNTCPDRSTVEPSFSNIKDGASKFFGSKKRVMWIREATVGHNESWCNKCEFNSWCKSGCPITKNQNFGECSGYKKYLLHIKEFAGKSEENMRMIKEYANL